MPLSLGDSASLSKVITDADVRTFAALSLDFNPIHLDEAAGQASRFGQRISHGLLYGALVSAVIGTQLPGPGSIYLNQSFQFLQPVFRGDEITALVTVQRLDPARRRVELRTDCRNQSGVLVLTGTALVVADAGHFTAEAT